MVGQNIRLSVFMDLGLYNKLMDIAKSRKITYKTDSELIKKVIFDYWNKIEDMLGALYHYQAKEEHFKTEKARLESIIEKLRDDCSKLNQEIEIIKTNKNRSVKKSRLK